MAVINPPGFLQNAGATHTAEQMRNHFNLYQGARFASTSLIPRGGVHPAMGNNLQVTQTGSPSMAVIVKSGLASVPGTEGAKQGMYSVLNDADLTLSITAAHATLNRIDLVVFKVEDTAFSGAVNTSSLVVVTGTPASSPAAPTAPANSIILAQVSIVALDSSITTGEITDRRHYMSAVGGVINCTSATRPAAGIVAEGQQIYETDTDRIYITHNGGTTWTRDPINYQARQTLSGTQAVITFSGIPSTLRSLKVRWTARCNDAGSQQLLQCKVNNDATGVYYDTFYSAIGAGGMNTNLETTNTNWRIGRAAAAAGGPNDYGVGYIDFVGWDSPHTNHLGAIWRSFVPSGGQVTEDGGGTYNNVGPYNRLDFIIAGGASFVAGTDFQIEGIYA